MKNKKVKDIYKRATGAEKDGYDLMSNAFAFKLGKSKEDPITDVRDSSLDEMSQQSMQEGFHHLFMGAMKAVRNPRAHATLEEGKMDAFHHLFLASILMNVLSEGKTR